MPTINTPEQAQFFLAARCGEKLYRAAARYETSDLYEPHDMRDGGQVVADNLWISTEFIALNYFDSTNIVVFTVGITELSFEEEQVDNFLSAEPIMSNVKIIAINVEDDPLSTVQMATRLLTLLNSADCRIYDNGLLFDDTTKTNDGERLVPINLGKIENRLTHAWL